LFAQPAHGGVPLILQDPYSRSPLSRRHTSLQARQLASKLGRYFRRHCSKMIPKGGGAGAPN
jgi:hypothetical protein